MGIGPHGNTVSIYEEQTRSHLQKAENLYWPLCFHLQDGPQLQLFNFPICIMESHAALAVISSCLHSTGNNQLNYKMKIILHPIIMHQELKAVRILLQNFECCLYLFTVHYMFMSLII